MVIIATSNDPLYRLNAIYDRIYSAKYPNDYSVINDGLRSSLREAYDAKMNLLDTHKFSFGNHTGYVEPETYYIYEGDGNSIIFKRPIIEEDTILGVYPEGILLGFIDAKLRDFEYRKAHASTFYIQMYQLALSYVRSHKFDTIFAGTAYKTYLQNIPYLFALAKCIDSGITIEDLLEDIEIDSVLEYIMKDKDNFKKIVGSCDYSKIYKYIIDIPQITFDEEPKIVDKSINKEFDEKYHELVATEEEEKKAISDIMDEIIDHNKEQVNDDIRKEFHLYLYYPNDPNLSEAAICMDYYTTKKQLENEANVIITTNANLISTDLIRKGYRIFVHVNSDTINEIKIGTNTWTDREVRWGHNLQHLIFNHMVYLYE